MCATKGATTDRQILARSGRSRRQTASVVIAIVAFAAVAGLLLPTALGGWGPVLHWACVRGGPMAFTTVWAPAILVNAPYGGSASGNATIPAGVIANGTLFGIADGTDASNGSFAGVFFHLRAQLFPQTSELEWGPGRNDRCTDSEGVGLATDFNGTQVYSGILGGTGNWSDAAEPHEFDIHPGPGVYAETVYSSNAFRGANSKPVSTCGGAAQSLPAVARGPTVLMSFLDQNRVTTIAFSVPFPEVFHYYFPANSGTWQVDNLSAPGGPGGGWAFSYSPCP